MTVIMNEIRAEMGKQSSHTTTICNRIVDMQQKLFFACSSLWRNRHLDALEWSQKKGHANYVLLLLFRRPSNQLPRESTWSYQRRELLPLHNEWRTRECLHSSYSQSQWNPSCLVFLDRRVIYHIWIRIHLASRRRVQWKQFQVRQWIPMEQRPEW